MRFRFKWGLVLIPAFALAMPAFAAPRDPRLSDSQQPGSVIIFPKFSNNTPVNLDTATGPLLPRTEIELGVVCPPGVTPTTTVCFEHQTVKVHGHWVCPGTQDITQKYICPETDFVLFLSVNGKLAFSADGRTYFSNQPRVPKPACANGYLILWVVDNADRPIKWDGLIGDAVLRGPENAAGAAYGVGTSTAVSAYSGITVQAATGLEHGALIPNARTGLNFDARSYLGLTNVLYGDVRFDNVATDPAHALPLPNGAFSRTYLTLITLDVLSNQPNPVTFAPIYFYNESLSTVSTTNPLWEFPISTAVHFLCYGQFALSTQIDGNLTQEFMGARKGVFVAGPATQVEGPFGEAGGGEATLLGLVHTIEGTAGNAYQERSYIYTTYNDSFFIPTTFEWLSTVHPAPATGG